MRDFTSKHLEAALIDQIAAGAFQGKAYAFTEVYDAGFWKLGVAVANEPGYHPFKKVFRDRTEAQEWASGLNKHIGVSSLSALKIISSTMGSHVEVLDR